MNQLRVRLDALIQEKHLLTHNFYQRWQMGKLAVAELQGYAKEYYRFESEFPRFISAIHTNCSDLKMRQLLLENLIHEERGEENHPELWLQFAEGLGVSREEVKSHFHSDETEHLVRTYRGFCENPNLIEGLAALYAYERQQPDVARSKADGLKANYGIKEESTLAFFRAHQSVDVYHAEAEMSLLAELCHDENAQNQALKAAEKTLNSLHDFLDGVERRYTTTV